MDVKKPSLKIWIQAARLRTLPLAFSSIITGSLLARADGHFSWVILVLALLTTLLYQVLSNYANDYGDGIRGTDHQKVGEQRAVASGQISPHAMKKAVLTLSILAFWSGTLLSVLALQPISWTLALIFVGLGLLAVLAAISYTIGKQAYAYLGLGDPFVFLFFGLLGVCGSYFIQAKTLDALIWLPAAAIGMLSAGVLNLNNMRDIPGDTQAGKQTIALRLGLKGARIYHSFLLLGSFILLLTFFVLRFEHPGQWVTASGLILIIINWIKALKVKTHKGYDPLLKPLAISTLLIALLIGLGVNLPNF
jgi:1,4-dihydroxy-2-naphthoate octaprenyltransferase